MSVVGDAGFFHSHQLAVLIVGQDLSDVPVSRRDGLESVCAGVGLQRKKKQKTNNVMKTSAYKDNGRVDFIAPKCV